MSQSSLYDAISAVGYAPPEEIIWDGNLHRFPTDSAKRYSKDGWYVAHDDALGKAAAFGSWRDGVNHAWSNGTGRKLTLEEWAATEEKKRRALAEEKQRREQAALRAQRLYDEASADPTLSPYLQRKGIFCPAGVKAVQGASSRAFGFEGTEFLVSGLIVPMRDRSGAIRSLQLIPDDAKRNKLFMKGGQTAACFHTLGSLEGASRILIGEGLATCQSAHQALDAPALVAFSAGNLPDIADIARARNATAEIIILGDDDDAGRLKANPAAKRVNGRVVFPSHGCNDFNDLHVAHGLDAVREAILGAKTTDAGADDAANEDWKADLIIKHKDDGSQVIPCRVHNLILILTHAPEFKGRVRFNEFSAQVSIDGKDIDDIGPVKIKAQLERQWIKEKIPTGDIVEAMTVVASRHPFHPVRDYLDALKWDGIERIPDFCSDFFGCAKDPYHIAAGKSLFVSSVARIYKPGAKVDTMMILQGIQGTRKTSTWQALFGEWCAEVTSSLNDKDFFSGLRGVWCADFGELDQFSKAEVTRIKQVITQTFDHYRPHYGRQHQRFPRQCVFVGGTNLDNWQTDATGARRYLPVDVKHEIDVEAIAAIRDQLWAEAVVRFQRGETWWHIPDAGEHQEKSYVGDTWEEIIGQWLSEEYMKPQMPGETFAFLLGSVLNNALKIDPGKQTRSDQTRAGSVMRRLGWASRQETHGGQRVRVYYPSPEWIATHDAIKQEAARRGY